MRLRGWTLAFVVACMDKPADTGAPPTDTVPATETALPTDTAPTGTTYVCAMYTPTWTGVQDLFEASCDGCHRTAAQAGRLDLRVAITDDLLSGAGLYVVPGNPDASTVWRVISGGELPRMPPGLNLLPPEETCHVRDWILAGASLE